MKAIHAKRLLKLADFLKALPPQKFDYCSWVGSDWKGKQDLSCGTTGCALGWACAMPDFRRLGLKFRKIGNKRTGYTGFPMVPGKTQDGEGHAGHASRVVFGLSHDQHNLLFMPKPYNPPTGPTGDATPKQVAAHIRKFVRRNWAGYKAWAAR